MNASIRSTWARARAAEARPFSETDEATWALRSADSRTRSSTSCTAANTCWTEADASSTARATSPAMAATRRDDSVRWARVAWVSSMLPVSSAVDPAISVLALRTEVRAATLAPERLSSSSVRSRTSPWSSVEATSAAETSSVADCWTPAARDTSRKSPSSCPVTWETLAEIPRAWATVSWSRSRRKFTPRAMAAISSSRPSGSGAVRSPALIRSRAEAIRSTGARTYTRTRIAAASESRASMIAW